MTHPLQRFGILVICIALASGCITTSGEVAKARDEGIQMGQAMAKPRAEGDYQWQLVKRPTAVRGGVVIPEHDEWVLFQGGKTQPAAYMIPPPASATQVVDKAGPSTAQAESQEPKGADLPPSAPAPPPDQQVITKESPAPVGKTTGKGSLSALFIDAAFQGKTRDLILDKEITYEDLTDLAVKLQGHFGCYVDVVDGRLSFAEVKEQLYETGFATDDIAKGLKDNLNHPQAKAIVNRAAGTIAVTDDMKGHTNLQREIQARNDQYTQYRYEIILIQGGKAVSTAEGVVAAAQPARFTEGGGITLAIKGRQMMASVVYGRYPDMVTGIINKEGGEVESRRDDLQMKVRFSKK